MKRILITGGTRGIGRVITQHMLESEYEVIVCSRTEQSCDKARKEFKQWGSLFSAFQTDVSDHTQVIELVEQFDRIDVLVNNAGIYGPAGSFIDNDICDWMTTLEVNVMGPLYMCQEVAPLMIKNKFGRIINMSGGGATKPMPNYSAYCASKAAIVRFTEVIAEELKEHNITVNAIAPGFIATDIHEVTLQAGPEVVGKFYEETVERLERTGDDPEPTAKLVEFISNDDCTVTGRLYSALHDPWIHASQNSDLHPEMYMLRRVDDYFIKVSE